MTLPIELPSHGTEAPALPGKLTPQGVLLLNQVIAEFRQARQLPPAAPAPAAPPPRRRRPKAAASEPAGSGK